ncbi:vancomycin permeability regulator SanA [Saccharothrix ecbatanensis]|uniref:Vancomycin permeability regulator SanA n=1 Tax=Saccharothrix ecbatanensis TaxID=1105145 RepID=A0A7W9M5M0_9PSEU|nr:ElyC/SanA/YdcF family protein [Saccharothrix ecbatanensis]MBB5808079.1 vancomycin permeability regulator SanA [Saccharothrix ecbatanensis]
MGDFFRRLRWKRVLIALGLLAVLAATPWVWVQTSSAAYRHTAADVPDAPVGLVLGAGLTSAGTPTAFLAGRLDVAADLYRRGKVEVLLVSGDNSRTGYDEPSAMRTYLIDKGVPEELVVADYAGLDTWDSCTRAKRIFGVERATVVTQEFHLPRAVALCRSAGIEAFGVGHDTSRQWATTTAYGHFRETAAAAKAMWDGLVAKPEPRFLGPRETGVTSALER